MSASLQATDPLEELFSSDADDSAELIPDPENGYDRVVLRPELVDAVEQTYCAAMAQAEIDWAPIFRKMAEHEAIYEGKGDPSDPVSTITIPIVKRIVNQQQAWLSGATLGRDPYLTCKPIDDGDYELPATMDDEGGMQVEKIPSDEAAKLWQSYIQYVLTERIDFGQLLDDTLYAIHAGENPTYWKVEYQPRTKIIKQKKYAKVSDSDNVVKILGYEDTKVSDGEDVTIKHVFGGNCLMPIDQTDVQRSPWFSEKTPMTTLEMWKGIKDKVIDFGLGPDTPPDPNDIADVVGLTTDETQTDVQVSLAMIDRHIANDAERTHDVRTLWFYYPIKRTMTVPSEDGSAAKSVSIIEIRSLCGKVHYTARKLLSLYVNPYPRRPYDAFFLKKRPHRFSGTSSAEDLAPFQRLISQVFHLQIQNAVQQNVKVFLIRENSVTWRYMKRPENKLRPGLMIPYADQGDVKAEQLGAPVASMAGEITYLTGEAQRLSVVSDYDVGADVPNRTPAATVAQIEQLAKMQPQAVLRQIRRPIARAVTLWVQVRSQYSQYATFPFLDDEKQRRITKLIAFVRNDFERHFSLEVTATGDEDTASARVERGSMLLKETNLENEAVLKLSQIVMDPKVPTQAKEPAIKMWIRLERVYGDMLSAVMPDSAKYVFGEDEIRALATAVPPPPPPPPEQPIQGEPNAQLSPEGAGGPPQLPAGPPGLGPPPGQPSDQGMAQPPAQ